MEPFESGWRGQWGRGRTRQSLLLVLLAQLPLGFGDGLHVCEGGAFGHAVDYDDCTNYWSCSVACDDAGDCPAAGGTAEPHCVDSRCALHCEGAQCPIGMECVPAAWEADPPTCRWPEALAHPGCPAYCLAEPPPADCAG